MKDNSTAWNRGKAVGERCALSLDESQSILKTLRLQEAHHDACLFAIGIDSMLRCSDLLQLRVRDIVSHTGQIRWRQKKTRRNVYPVLTATSLEVLQIWIETSGKTPPDFLFTRDKPIDGLAISPAYYRSLIKQWVQLVGLKPEQYSSHSLRRTKPTFLYHHGYSDLEHIARLLGHANTDATSRYLGIQKKQAQAHALVGDIFTISPDEKIVGHPLLREFLKPDFLDQFLDELVFRIHQKLSDFLDENPKKGRE